MRIDKQLTESDCAVWAIKAMCFRMGLPVPPGSVVRRHIDLDDQGTSIRGVRNALEAFGIVPRPVIGPSDSIARAPLPAIAMIKLADNLHHYVVVLDADEHNVRILDPAVGGWARNVSAAGFSEMFTGNLVLCQRQPKYVAIDFDKEPDADRFMASTWLHEWQAILAVAMGEIFQLAMLLVGILLLKSFFSSSLQGPPNLWFLSGIALCGMAFVWIAALSQAIKGQIQSRTLLSLFDFTNSLIRNSEFDPKGGLHKASSRCVKSITSVANHVTGIAMLPGHTISLVLYIALLAWIDPYAGWYAGVVAMVMPIYGLWSARKRQISQSEASKSRGLNEVGLVYLLAGSNEDEGNVSDLMWNQLEYCESLERHRKSVVSENMIYESLGRLNIFAGLLIGGLQHASFGLGHTVAVFFLLSIYTGVVGRWARKVSSYPESRHHVRSLLDFLSDFTAKPLDLGDFESLRSVRSTRSRSFVSLHDRATGIIK